MEIVYTIEEFAMECASDAVDALFGDMVDDPREV